jgi:hypothetical protein
MPDDPTPDPAKPDPSKPADPPVPDPKPADPATADPAKPSEKDASQAEVEKAYEKLRLAEKERDEERRKNKEREDAELSETERLRKENEEKDEKVANATAKVQKANLLNVLADKGLTGGKARAAARLLDDVEYDDDGEPTNLDAALDAAKAAFGETQFTPADPAKPAPPNLNGGAGSQPGPTPNLTAEEIKAAEDAGIAPQTYEALKEVQSYEDWVAMRERIKAAAPK